MSGSIEAVAKQFASRLGLIAFFTASARGLICGADFEATIQTALIATAIFYFIGSIVGRLARQLIEEHVEIELQQLLASEFPMESATGPSGPIT